MSETKEPPSENLYPIREELVADYVRLNRADLLVSLLNTFKSQRDRAERMRDIYEARVRELEAKLRADDTTMITRPTLRAKRAEGPAEIAQRSSSPEPKKPDLAIDI